jgi:hypothetical protein
MMDSAALSPQILAFSSSGRQFGGISSKQKVRQRPHRSQVDFEHTQMKAGGKFWATNFTSTCGK